VQLKLVFHLVSFKERNHGKESERAVVLAHQNTITYSSSTKYHALSSYKLHQNYVLWKDFHTHNNYLFNLDLRAKATKRTMWNLLEASNQHQSNTTKG